MTRDTYKAIMMVATMCELPFGTKVRLKDDYPGVTHVVNGYNMTPEGSYMEFRDGSRLNIANIEQIESVII